MGDSLLNRFERVGADSDLDRAIDVKRRALGADRARLLDHTAMKYDLAYALSRRFNRTRSATDLAEAINLARSAVEAAEPDHVFRAPTQNLLEAMLRVNTSRPDSL
ncbi:tetratricopeptide repeat protein [Streptomyces tailanensis]|uniref:tetratricopeptide repeat protein n=1 Tax=Streptomyces tailanensis TaxID=2569858 RepID=UPI00122E8556|nr:tetratricopeptide repeat protein [Streptomyces tailanensis]